MARSDIKYWAYKGPGFGLPIALILIGLFFLGKDIGWFEVEVSFWPILLIAIGAWLLVNRLRTLS